MNPYLEFVQQTEQRIRAARKLPLGGFAPCAGRRPAANAPKALLFSPHPDDECLTGLLPLRLMREAGMRIINVPVTFGSNVARRPGRAEELDNACRFLGFEIFRGSENRGPESPARFLGLEKAGILAILRQIRPAIVFMPHARDWNSRHVATNALVFEALDAMPADFACAVIETEFWAPMDDPNLMVEADAATLADLVAALSFHVKEVERNPYHLTLPAWMQDTVRRAGELIVGQGGAAPDFMFAAVYRLSRREAGKTVRVPKKGRLVGTRDDVRDILE